VFEKKKERKSLDLGKKKGEGQGNQIDFTLDSVPPSLFLKVATKSTIQKMVKQKTRIMRDQQIFCIHQLENVLFLHHFVLLQDTLDVESMHMKPTMHKCHTLCNVKKSLLQLPPYTCRIQCYARRH